MRLSAPAQSRGGSKDPLTDDTESKGGLCRVILARIWLGAELTSLQAELEGTSCQISCPGASPLKDCEPSARLGLTSNLF